jgi:hypothetical protein
MPTSRYINTRKDGPGLETRRSIPKKELDKIRTLSIRVTDQDRLDTLAFKHLGSGEYWWVIAEINELKWAWDFVPGQVMKIPLDIEDVLRLIR